MKITSQIMSKKCFEIKQVEGKQALYVRHETGAVTWICDAETIEEIQHVQDLIVEASIASSAIEVDMANKCVTLLTRHK